MVPQSSRFLSETVMVAHLVEKFTAI